MKDLRAPEKKFRPELEGVRAVAALLVAVYHIWVGSVSGGVDVFFIVSGFLITTSLISRMEREGKINFSENLLGLAKRLFPLAYTVLLLTALFSIMILPITFWNQTIAELFASAFYFENWLLATNSVDYLAQNNEASPYQHFWALSIQGQFYVTWPLLITLVYFLARKVFKTPLRKTLLASLGIIFVFSLSYSIYITDVNQPWAYFDTFARMWEFSLGGILALLIPYLRLTEGLSLLAGWLGLSIVCFTGILLPVSTVFPGYAALLPITGVMLIILSAENSGSYSAQKMLSSKPFQYFGGVSYGFYLWHWPLLVMYYAYFETEEVPTVVGFLILLITFFLSLLTVKFIEAPIRNLNVRRSKGRLGKVLAVLIAPVLITGISWSVYVQAVLNETTEIEDLSVENYPGGRMISDGIIPTVGLKPLPGAVEAQQNLPLFYEDSACFSTGDETEVKKCSFGDTVDPDYTIALVGGSHSGHWFPALLQMADELNLQIDVYNKDACRFSSGNFDGVLTDACMEWNEDLTIALKEQPPDLIFTTANVNKQDFVPEGYIEKWREFEGITNVLAVRDNPRMKDPIPLCVETEDLSECSVPTETALSEIAPWENTANLPGNVSFADMSEYFCDEQTCYPVMGNVVIYRDQHHITTLYSQTLASGLKEHVMMALEKSE